MSKTARIRAELSVAVPLADTVFSETNVEVWRSPSLQIQTTKYANYPGQQQVSIFDRNTEAQVSFQSMIAGAVKARFYCNETTEQNAQANERQAEKTGMDVSQHFEFLDMVEENDRVYRHFRMMPLEDFLTYMGAKSASERPSDAYYEYWDDAETLAPHRLLSPDGSVIVFHSVEGSTTDATTNGVMQSMGKSTWANLMTCSPTEKDEEATIGGQGTLRVPDMVSGTIDLVIPEIDFYARQNQAAWLASLGVSTGPNPWETLNLVAAEPSHPASRFANYAIRSTRVLAMPDICRDACLVLYTNVEAQLTTGTEFCSATALDALAECFVAIGTSNRRCGQTNFLQAYNECQLPTTRRLEEDYEQGEEEDKAIPSVKAHQLSHEEEDTSAIPSAKKGLPNVRKLPDGTEYIDIAEVSVAHRLEIAQAFGMKDITKGRVMLNSTAADTAPALVQAKDPESGDTHERRLMMDMNCLAFNVGPGCLFKKSYPVTCDPIDGDPPCDWGLSVKLQVGGPANGAITVAGAGTVIDSFAFGVPRPLKGTVTWGASIGVSWNGQCGFPFMIQGTLSLTATVGLDLVIFSFSAASLQLQAGVGLVTYKHSCDDRRRRRRWWGGRRRGSDNVCQTSCDIRVHGQITLQVLIGRVWLRAEYYFTWRDFNLIAGVDVYIWAVFTSWWHNCYTGTIV